MDDDEDDEDNNNIHKREDDDDKAREKADVMRGLSNIIQASKLRDTANAKAKIKTSNKPAICPPTPMKSPTKKRFHVLAVVSEDDVEMGHDNTIIINDPESIPERDGNEELESSVRRTLHHADVHTHTNHRRRSLSADGSAALFHGDTLESQNEVQKTPQASPRRDQENQSTSPNHPLSNSFFQTPSRANTHYILVRDADSYSSNSDGDLFDQQAFPILHLEGTEDHDGMTTAQFEAEDGSFIRNHESDSLPASSPESRSKPEDGQQKSCHQTPTNVLHQVSPHTPLPQDSKPSTMDNDKEDQGFSAQGSSYIWQAPKGESAQAAGTGMATNAGAPAGPEHSMAAANMDVESSPDAGKSHSSDQSMSKAERIIREREQVNWSLSSGATGKAGAECSFVTPHPPMPIPQATDVDIEQSNHSSKQSHDMFMRSRDGGMNSSESSKPTSHEEEEDKSISGQIPPLYGTQKDKDTGSHSPLFVTPAVRYHSSQPQATAKAIGQGSASRAIDLFMAPQGSLFSRSRQASPLSTPVPPSSAHPPVSRSIFSPATMSHAGSAIPIGVAAAQTASGTDPVHPFSSGSHSQHSRPSLPLQQTPSGGKPAASQSMTTIQQQLRGSASLSLGSLVKEAPSSSLHESLRTSQQHQHQHQQQQQQQQLPCASCGFLNTPSKHLIGDSPFVPSSASKRIRYSVKRGVWEGSPATRSAIVGAVVATPLRLNVNPFSPDVREKRRKTYPEQYGSSASVIPTVVAAAGASATVSASTSMVGDTNPEVLSELVGAVAAPAGVQLPHSSASLPAVLSAVKATGELGFPPRMSRYKQDFEEIEEIGLGSFGRVFRCRKRIDGWDYAVKATRRKIRGESDMQNVLREVYALAALGDNKHVVRYYSAWVEQNILYIQTEYLPGSSIGEAWKAGNLVFDEDEIRELIFQVASGLNHFHSQQLVHLDIKPENLFLTEDGIYKIGDLGLTTFSEESDVQERSLSSGDLSEGDSRYLCREMLEEKYAHLTKADIFALGLTAYELACEPSNPLPSMGSEWVAIRNGKLPPIDKLTPELNELLRQMTHPNPSKRPSAPELMLHPLITGRVRTRPRDKEVESEILTLESRVRSLEQALLDAGKDPSAI